MSEIRYRFVGDALAFEFAVVLDDVPTPIPSATLSCGLLGPDGTVIAGTAAWLASPDDHVVRCTIAGDKTTRPGRHQLQLKITDASLAEPARGRVFFDLQPSAV